MPHALSVVVLGFGAEPYLEDCLAALVAELRPADEVVLVDNGVEDIPWRRLRWGDRVRVVGDGLNRGFAGGCNLGAAMTDGEALAFVNSDAIVRPGALAALRRRLSDAGVGLACGCLRLADRPELVNSAGNPMHFVGITWAGGCGEPATAYATSTDVAVATGGLFAVSRTTWTRLGGFDDIYFAYHEDTDLSVRCWLGGQRVVFEPSAVADHHYEFSRNPRKMYLLERNRFLTVLCDYPSSVLWRVLPALLVLEPLFFVMAILQGWAGQKARAWWWLLTHAKALRRRRAQVMASVPSEERALKLMSLMTDRIEPPQVQAPPGMGLVNALLAAYWSLVGAGDRAPRAAA